MKSYFLVLSGWIFVATFVTMIFLPFAVLFPFLAPVINQIRLKVIPVSFINFFIDVVNKFKKDRQKNNHMVCLTLTSSCLLMLCTLWVYGQKSGRLKTTHSDLHSTTSLILITSSGWNADLGYTISSFILSTLASLFLFFSRTELTFCSSWWTRKLQARPRKGHIHIKVNIQRPVLNLYLLLAVMPGRRLQQ